MEMERKQSCNLDKPFEW